MSILWLQVALRLLLLATLVAAAKAVADRVVPEEQFYDQAAEDAHAAEQAPPRSSTLPSVIISHLAATYSSRSSLTR